MNLFYKSPSSLLLRPHLLPFLHVCLPSLLRLYTIYVVKLTSSTSSCISRCAAFVTTPNVPFLLSFLVHSSATLLLPIQLCFPLSLSSASYHAFCCLLFYFLFHSSIFFPTLFTALYCFPSFNAIDLLPFLLPFSAFSSALG